MDAAVSGEALKQNASLNRLHGGEQIPVLSPQNKGTRVRFSQSMNHNEDEGCFLPD